MQAIILAAGMGRRLKELTSNNTKCMIEVNGVSLIERLLCQLDGLSLSRIVIVTGYEGKKLETFVTSLSINTRIIFVKNPIYESTNNIYSLYLCKDWLIKEDTLLFESDLILDDEIIDIMVNDSRDTLAIIDKYEPWMDGTCVRINSSDEISEFIPRELLKPDDIDEYYKTVNIYKFGMNFSRDIYIPYLEAYQMIAGTNEFYEQVLRVITMLDRVPIPARRLDGQRWYEIDDAEDLENASSIFSTDPIARTEDITGRYGGYWRFQNLTDFCYPVNPLFPPEQMINEISASLNQLLTRYPSGAAVNSRLAARLAGVDEKNILAGNGASELIKALMDKINGRVGIIRPTFEEYINRLNDREIICYTPDNMNFSYSAQVIMDYFSKKNISTLIIVNPDNPSGNYIEKGEMLRLIDWSNNRGIKLVIDESFIDFTDEDNPSVIQQDILDANSCLYVIKSISKSYGIPGLRLGFLASGDIDTIEVLKQDSSLWNINSFAEFFMQIFSRYENQYITGLSLFRRERKAFISKLSNIPGLRVIPSQANYIMIEVDKRCPVKFLQVSLLEKHSILIKTLSGKFKMDNKNYIRVAIRTADENERLAAALEAELKKYI